MASNIDDRLRLLIERVERLEGEKKGISDDIRDVYLEAKAVGYDVKSMRQIVRLRKMKPDDRREMAMILDTYKAALGMDSAPELFRAHDGRPDPALAAPAPGTPKDELYAAACAAVVKHRKASTSWLQRQLRIGFNQAAGLIERMEAAGVISPPSPIGTRTVVLDSLDSNVRLLAADLAAKGVTMTVSAGPQATRAGQV